MGYKHLKKLPSKCIIPNPYNVPIHNQNEENSCTSHAFAAMMEYLLSDLFHERISVDVDDLWEKQKKFGTATEEDGDYVIGPFKIAEKYGVKFRTESGKRGIYFFDGNIIWYKA